jgi:hypothetical protein
MIEKDESKNPGHKQATEGMPASDNLVRGEYLADQYEIPDHDTIDYDYLALPARILWVIPGYITVSRIYQMTCLNGPERCPI